MINLFHNTMLELLRKKLWLGKILLLVRKVLLKFHDPIVSSKIGSEKMLMNLSHMLPIYKATLKLYDTTLPRIVKYVESKNKNPIIIDVGANVGDTAALILEVSENTIVLCIEGSSDFTYLLEKNFDENKNVFIEKCFLTDINTTQNKKLISQNGTATLSSLNSGTDDVYTDTLDNIIKNKYSHLNFDILKVDTDGYDYKVIRGSKNIISSNKPLIYFELVPMLLKNNNEEVISIFTFLQELNYSDVMIYDNLGYLLGLFKITNIRSIEMLIEYIDSKNMYLDILVSTENLEVFYNSEVKSIQNILNLDCLKTRYGYNNTKEKDD